MSMLHIGTVDVKSPVSITTFRV